MRQRAVELQKRDLAMLGSLLRWGLLPAWFLAAWYFARSKRTAENRLGLLRRAGYLQRVETWWRGPLVVAPTERGRAARPDLCLGTPEVVESTRLKHRLEVVRVADHLLRDGLCRRGDVARQRRRGGGQLPRLRHGPRAARSEAPPRSICGRIGPAMLSVRCLTWL
jgi:hypothetical protein